MNHFAVPVYYAGTTYQYAPWHYPFVLTAITIPIFILVFFFIGCIYIILFKKAPEFFFILLQAFFPLLILAEPSVPKYDGIRHFLPAIPFILVVCGLGMFYLQKIFSKKGLQNIYFLILTTLIFYTFYFSFYKTHPFYGIYYNEISQITKIQNNFELDYFGQSYKQLIPKLQNHTNTSFWVPFATDAFLYYQTQGYIDKTIKISYNCPECSYLILLNRQGFISSDPHIQSILKRDTPYYSLMFHDYPILLVYKL